MVSRVRDRVEIGDVEALEASDAQQSARHVERIARRRERRDDRPVASAITQVGAHDRSAHEIENRNDLHVAIVQATAAGCTLGVTLSQGRRGSDMTSVVRWDIGGAHLKAARAENGRVVEAMQIASPLRLGIEAIDRAFAQAKPRMSGADRQICTMTGELADTFASRADGVVQLVAAAARALQPEQIVLYAGRAGFIAPQDAAHHVEDVASANWHATATLVAKIQGSALMIDMGSTTTDVVPVVDRAVAARGYTDAERLACGELVYTGLVRSFVMAIAERAPLAGCWTPLVHENFANMADVHRLLRNLPEGADQMPTADGRP